MYAVLPLPYEDRETVSDRHFADVKYRKTTIYSVYLKGGMWRVLPLLYEDIEIVFDRHSAYVKYM